MPPLPDHIAALVQSCTQMDVRDRYQSVAQLPPVLRITPPWSLSLPAQIVLVEALRDRQYYERCYATTHELRDRLSSTLTSAGFVARSSMANFMLVEYPSHLPPIEDFLSDCADHRLLLRDVRNMGTNLKPNCFRTAVKNEAMNARMLEILKRIISFSNAHAIRKTPACRIPDDHITSA